MGKFYISMFAVSMLATTVFAHGMTSSPLEYFNNAHPTEKSIKTNTREESEDLVGNLISKVVTNGETNEDLPTVLIKDTPEGKLYSDMNGVYHGYKSEWRKIIESSSDSKVVDCVEAEDGFFYIKNIFSTYVTNTWIKGVKVKGRMAQTPDTIVVSLPQKVLEAGDGMGGTISFYAQKLHLTKDEGGNITAKVKEDDNEVRFTWINDTLKMVGNDVLGITNSKGVWRGYGDDSIQIYMLRDEPTSLPASVKATDFTVEYLNSDDESEIAFVKGAKDGNNIYISNTVDGQDFWIKGYIENDKIYFKQQYLGADYKILNHLYFCPATVNDKGTNSKISFLKGDLVFDYNADKGTFFTGGTFLINKGNTVPGTDTYTAAKYSPWEDKAYQPEAPVITTFMEYSDYYEYAVVKFELGKAAKDGNILAPDKYFYKMYINDEPYTFTTDNYFELKDNMIEIPCNFDDGYDFSVSGTEHSVNLYRDDIRNIGIRAVYKGGNETTESDITWYKTPSGINLSTVDQANALNSVTYTDLAGRKVLNPIKGLYIKTIKGVDGTVTGIKVIK